MPATGNIAYKIIDVAKALILQISRLMALQVEIIAQGQTTHEIQRQDRIYVVLPKTLFLTLLIYDLVHHRLHKKVSKKTSLIHKTKAKAKR